MKNTNSEKVKQIRICGQVFDLEHFDCDECQKSIVGVIVHFMEFNVILTKDKKFWGFLNPICYPEDILCKECFLERLRRDQKYYENNS